MRGLDIAALVDLGALKRALQSRFADIMTCVSRSEKELMLMDRMQWRRERRLWNEVQMDTIHARRYDERWGAYINPTHQLMLERLLNLCPPGGRVLDAACGTGKYWPILLERGFSVMGTDQSQRMLQQAHAKFADVLTEHVGLQELPFADAFDGVICMDAMEEVSRLPKLCR